MSIKERTREFIKSQGISMKEFEQRCGLSTGYVTSMRKGFGIDKLNNVLKAFPELNRDWLLYGEGPMLVGDVTGDNNAIGHGASVTTTNDSRVVEKLLDEISEQRRLVSESQRQVDRLLSIVEKMTNNM